MKKKILPKDFGKDHWSLLAYIETRCVDYKGVLDIAHLRVKNLAIGSPHTPFDKPKWKSEYGTRLRGYFTNKLNEVDKKFLLPNHDDLDCFDDLEEAGYIENTGTGLNPACIMTKLGSQVISLLRQHKAKGEHYATFTL